MANEIHELVYFSVMSGKREVFESCRIMFNIDYKGNRRHDPDNANLKPFVDGLVKAGIIKDDNSKIIKEISVRVRTKQKSDRIIIQII